MTFMETESILYSLLIFIIGLVIGMVVGHGKPDSDDDNGGLS